MQFNFIVGSFVEHLDSISSNTDALRRVASAIAGAAGQALDRTSSPCVTAELEWIKSHFDDLAKEAAAGQAVDKLALGQPGSWQDIADWGVARLGQFSIARLAKEAHIRTGQLRVCEYFTAGIISDAQRALCRECDLKAFDRCVNVLTERCAYLRRNGG